MKPDAKFLTIFIVIIIFAFSCSDNNPADLEYDAIEVTINNESHVDAYYIAFLPEEFDPQTAPSENWLVYSLGDDYVGPSSEKSFNLDTPPGTFCSVFVGRNTFEQSPIEKEWRWDQPYNGQDLDFNLYSEDSPPPYSEMVILGEGGYYAARNYIDLDPL